MSEYIIYGDDNLKHNIEDTIVAHIFNDITEQEVLEEILKDNEIPFVIRPFKDLALNGIYEATHGYSELLVYEHDMERVKKVIEDYRNQEIVEEDSDDKAEDGDS